VQGVFNEKDEHNNEIAIGYSYIDHLGAWNCAQIPVAQDSKFRLRVWT